MGFLTRLLIPRPVRRAAHPVRSAERVVRRTVMPKSVRSVTYAGSQPRNPLRATAYHGVERPLTRAMRVAQRSERLRVTSVTATGP